MTVTVSVLSLFAYNPTTPYIFNTPKRFVSFFNCLSLIKLLQEAFRLQHYLLINCFPSSLQKQSQQINSSVSYLKFHVYRLVW